MVKDVSSLTVGEIKKLLEPFDDDLPLMFAYNYGDRWDTKVLGEIDQVQEEAAKWSDYHQMFVLDDNGETPVLVLS